MESPTTPEQLKVLLHRLQEHCDEIFYVGVKIADLNEWFDEHYSMQTEKVRSFLNFLRREKRVLQARLEAVEDKRMAVLDEIYTLCPGVTITDSDGVRENMYRERERNRDPVLMEGWGQMRGVPVRDEDLTGFWASMWAFGEHYA
ncbi:uncharacterized protein H6S33_007977 [Morchella sextelata]|uniref:uncharacterized protein n=1 Tax=Morchella sextelata TaxID=1174677 RepID=UPI001D056316|nr:uncharacterized protein H6S33_007977 [Morchella sextelata]KAH0602973.1 hypothetical protein H6S33_007977 [Morchella sextelata]